MVVWRWKLAIVGTPAVLEWRYLRAGIDKPMSFLASFLRISTTGAAKGMYPLVRERALGYERAQGIGLAVAADTIYRCGDSSKQLQNRRHQQQQHNVSPCTPFGCVGECIGDTSNMSSSRSAEAKSLDGDEILRNHNRNQSFTFSTRSLWLESA